MDTKIILLSKRKKTVLSRLMIATLIEAYAKQNHKIPYGPADIKKGSFGALIKKDLITYQEIIIKNHTQSSWQVTSKGIDILKSLGVDIDS